MVSDLAAIGVDADFLVVPPKRRIFDPVRHRMLVVAIFWTRFAQI